MQQPANLPAETGQVHDSGSCRQGAQQRDSSGKSRLFLFCGFLLRFMQLVPVRQQQVLLFLFRPLVLFLQQKIPQR